MVIAPVLDCIIGVDILSNDRILTLVSAVNVRMDKWKFFALLGKNGESKTILHLWGKYRMGSSGK